MFYKKSHFNKTPPDFHNSKHCTRWPWKPNQEKKSKSRAIAFKQYDPDEQIAWPPASIKKKSPNSQFLSARTHQHREETGWAAGTSRLGVLEDRVWRPSWVSCALWGRPVAWVCSPRTAAAPARWSDWASTWRSCPSCPCYARTEGRSWARSSCTWGPCSGTARPDDGSCPRSIPPVAPRPPRAPDAAAAAWPSWLASMISASRICYENKWLGLDGK